MSLQKHNRWSRVIPPGFTCTALKNRLRLTTLTERERSVCRLVLDTAEPEFFTVTVKFIADSIGFSAEKQWPKVRDSLVQKGLLVCNAEKLGGGQQRWHLNFDFTPLAAGLFDREAEKLSTCDSKIGGSRARACDPPILGGSRDPSKSGGSRDPAATGGFEPEALKPKKPTSKAAAAFLLFDGHECLAVFKHADKNRIAAALGSAGEDQINTFIRALAEKVSSGRAKDPVAFAMYLAELTSRGELELAASGAMLPPSAAQVCATKATWRGDLRSPAGVVAVAKLDAGMGQLRAPTGPLFSIADSSLFWLRVDEGELDFVSATMSIS